MIGRFRAWLRAQAGFLICLVVPLTVGVLLNGWLRPWWAAELGGRRRAWSSTRGNNNWYEFSPEVREEHPALTSFLSLQDGEVSMVLAGVIVVLFLLRVGIRWLRTRPRRSAP